MNHIFISYARSDREFAEILYEKLKDEGFTVWMDIEGIRGGEEWRNVVDQAILNAAALIVVISSAAVESEYVTYEWAYALGAKIVVIPILLERIKLHSRLAVLQYMDFTNRASLPWLRLTSLLLELKDTTLPVVRQSREALNSVNAVERSAAIATLAQLNHPAAQDALVIAIRHPLPDVRYQATLALAQLKDKRAVPGLIEVMLGVDKDRRKTAAVSLSQIADLSVMPELLSLLKQRSDLRDFTVSIFKSWGSEAVPDLIDLLRDSNAEGIVRETAAIALGHIGNSQAVPALLNIIEDKLVDGKVRIASIKSVGQIGDPGAVTVLLKVTQDKQTSLKVREAGAESLGFIGDPSAVPALLEILLDESEDVFVRSASALALGRIGDISAVPSLISVLNSSFVNISQAALEALWRIGTPDAKRAVNVEEQNQIRRFDHDQHGQEIVEAWFMRMRDRAES